MAEKNKKKKKEKNNEANWMVSYSAELDCRTKQHTQFGVSASNGSRDMAPTKVAEKRKKKKKKKKKMNIDKTIQHPLRGSLIRKTNKGKEDRGRRKIGKGKEEE